MTNELHVTPDGLRVSFAQALNPGQAQDIERFSLRASDILWNQAYGSAEYIWGSESLLLIKSKQVGLPFRSSKASCLRMVGASI